MPGEVGAPRSGVEKSLSQSIIRAGQSMCDGQPKEYFWACTLTTASNSITWSTDEEEDNDDHDEDFLQHTLFLRHAVLGAGASNDRHLVEIETKDFHGEVMKSPIFSLKMGLDEMVALDLNFPNGIPVTIRLVEGSGPVHISGQQLLEFPPEEDMDETAAGLTEEDDDVEEDEEANLEEEGEEGEEEEEGSESEEVEDDKKKPAVKSTKRKASVGKTNKKAKGRRDRSASENGTDEDEEEEEEEEDPEESMEDDEDDEDYEEDKKSKKTKPKGLKTPPSEYKVTVGKGARVVKKTVKEKPAAAAKKGKKAKA